MNNTNGNSVNTSKNQFEAIAFINGENYSRHKIGWHIKMSFSNESDK